MSSSQGQGWDPDRYGQFETERSQPFRDLAALVEQEEALSVLDLGSGTGELTAWLHRKLSADETVGVDRSEAMINRAAVHAGDGVRFEHAEIEAFIDGQPNGVWPLVWSNAALQWLPDHGTLIPRILELVAPTGQIAIQMPVNVDNPSHLIARQLGTDPRFAASLDGYERKDTVQSPEWYAAMLHESGFTIQQISVQVYGHVLPETRSISDWVQGSLLTPYRERLSSETYSEFIEAYELRLIEQLGDHHPCFYPFKRLLIWGRRTI